MREWIRSVVIAGLERTMSNRLARSVGESISGSPPEKIISRISGEDESRRFKRLAKLVGALLGSARRKQNRQCRLQAKVGSTRMRPAYFCRMPGSFSLWESPTGSSIKPSTFLFSSSVGKISRRSGSFGSFLRILEAKWRETKKEKRELAA